MDVGAEVLKILLFMVFFAFHTTSGLPEDWKPRLGINTEESVLLYVFAGKGPDGHAQTLLNLQGIRIVKNEWVLVTSRNFIFVLDLKTLGDEDGSDILYSQVVPWLPENRSACMLKTADHNKCNNFIRVNAQMTEDTFLMCGTNAREPKCREYNWNATRFNGFRDGGRHVDLNKCPLDEEPSLAYLYSDGSLYTATRVGYRRDPAVRRTIVDGRSPSADFGTPLLKSSGTAVTRGEPLPQVSTDNNDVSMLNDAVFVSAIETKEKVYIFFREVAEEVFGNGKVTVSRVAQVCKNDRGGSKTYRSKKWTSYFKARLNCSAPGRTPFQFNELRHVTRSFVINGVTIVFAVMSTPENSILGSAVCAYSVQAIETAMTEDFMKRLSADTTTVCWSELGQNAPGVAHPSACLSEDEDTRDLRTDDLKFRKNHPLMQSSVQPITDIPLFMRTQARYVFTAIEAEVDVVHPGITLLYIGTSDGRLLKILPRPFDVDDRYDPNKKRKDGVFIEEMLIYNVTKCSKPMGKSMGTSEAGDSNNLNDADEETDYKRVLSVTAVEGRNLVLVAFQNCVIVVPKHTCSSFGCRRECVQSGNPYCGWLDGSCVVVTKSNRDKVEQDLFGAREDLPECLEGTSVTSPFVQANQCATAAAFAVPLAISMSVAFFVVLVVFFIVLKCHDKAFFGCRKRSQKREKSPRLSRDRSYLKNNASWTSERDASRTPIYTGPRGRNSTKSSASATASRHASFMGEATTAQQTYVGYNLEETSESASADILPPSAYASLDSIDSSFSKTSDSHSPISPDNNTDERRKFHGVHIVEDVKDSEDAPLAASSEVVPDEVSNLNNNNLRKNIGIAYALSRSESPLRRRSVSSQDKNCLPQVPHNRSIRMGSKSGTTAVRTPLRQTAQSLKSQHPRIVTNPNFMAVSPMPAQKVNRSQSQDSENAAALEPDAEGRRKSCGYLPKPPASGLTSTLPQQTRMVSNYTNISNSQNGTFRHGAAFPSPRYPHATAEPEYENVQRRMGSAENREHDPPTPPPPNCKPNRKLSSFTTSHFNTSWFPAPVTKEDNGAKEQRDHDAGIDQPCAKNSSSSGILSTSSSASTSIQCDNYYEEARSLTTCAARKEMIITKGILSAQSLLAHNNGKARHGAAHISRSSDDGYGSGFISNVEEGKQSNVAGSSPPSSLVFPDGVHVYDNVASNGIPALGGMVTHTAFSVVSHPTSDDEHPRNDLDEIQWTQGRRCKSVKKSMSGLKTLRKKTSLKKAKKNSARRDPVIDLSSPSDSDNNVFVDPVSLGDFDFNQPEASEFDIGRSEGWRGMADYQAFDDSFVSSKLEKYSESSPDKARDAQYAFHTMRPPGRMRQKLPRLRCGEKESDATLIAVPTPEIPKI